MVESLYLDVTIYTLEIDPFYYVVLGLLAILEAIFGSHF